MSTTVATFFNSNGHLQQSPISYTAEQSAVTDDSIILGTCLYKKTTGNVGKNTGASDAIMSAICGISDGTYASTATAGYFTDGEVIVLSGLTTDQEYWAVQDGTLGAYSAVTAGNTIYTRPMGLALSATLFLIRIGPIQLKP